MCILKAQNMMKELRRYLFISQSGYSSFTIVIYVVQYALSCVCRFILSELHMAELVCAIWLAHTLEYVAELIKFVFIS